MKRKCDRCENESTVHEVTIRDGKKIEKHLCEQCAKQDGLAVQSHAPINEIITKFVLSHGAAAPTRTPTCASCGLSFAEFRQHGLLGCAECYSAFEPQLGPLIERAHEGGTHHVGKTPRRGGGSVDRQLRIVTLRKQLSDAIAAEQYEKAASLRDELLNVDKPAEGAGA